MQNLGDPSETTDALLEAESFSFLPSRISVARPSQGKTLPGHKDNASLLNPISKIDYRRPDSSQRVLESECRHDDHVLSDAASVRICFSIRCRSSNPGHCCPNLQDSPCAGGDFAEFCGAYAIARQRRHLGIIRGWKKRR